MEHHNISIKPARKKHEGILNVDSFDLMHSVTRDAGLHYCPSQFMRDNPYQ